MFRNALTLTLLFLLGISPLLAQQNAAKVYGTVKDVNGEQLYGAQVYYKTNGQAIGTTTDERGRFSIFMPANKDIALITNFLGYKTDTVTLNLSPNENLEVNIWLKPGINIPIVEITAYKKDTLKKGDTKGEAGAISISLKDVGKLPSILQDDVSGLIKSQANVSSNNELSSSYSVRGGNYDENLVYVNGFEVYRPFLIRSGQQEGLSFANPHMIDSLLFSAGGFQAQYGDKMSSVLAAWYKQPDSLTGSLSIGLLGGSANIGGAIRNKEGEKKFTFLLGARYKSNQYILKSLETQGQYNPSFLDLQGFFTYRFTDKVRIEYITNYARNRFAFKPVDRETTFGVVNQVLRLNIYFDGQEGDSYQTYMNGLAIVQNPKPNLELRWMGSAYVSQENERYDILGEYFIGEVENDLGDENFGQVRYSLGVGGLQNFARNQLNWTVVNAEHKGTSEKGDHVIAWGLKYQREIIKDKLNEWERVDSAGYSIPYSSNEVIIGNVLKSSFNLNSNRINGYLMDTWMIDGSKSFRFNYGARFTWWDVNKELVISPRAQISYEPTLKNPRREIIITAASGLYAQPPFYREMRNLDGYVNTDLKAQKSVHAVLGFNYGFKLFKRDFRFITEVYYKYLYDIVPYEFDNVLIRYTGRNNATGYVAGVDLRLAGELVEDLESYISMSILGTSENIQGDFYDVYLDAQGNQVTANSDAVASSERRYPGNIPRPTDQRVMFNMFFQDYLPKNDNFKMHLNLVFASGLPFGPPDNDRYRDTLRIPPYRRVDIGFSVQIFNRAKRIEKKGPENLGKLGKGFENIWATLEVYNLLGINNTVSYLWIKDLNNTTYAVPNYLTARLINFRMVFKFS